MERKLVDILDVEKALKRKGGYLNLTEMALRKVPEAVVCCEKCEKYDSVGNGWGICREFDISSLVFRTEEDYCSRGILKNDLRR